MPRHSHFNLLVPAPAEGDYDNPGGYVFYPEAVGDLAWTREMVQARAWRSEMTSARTRSTDASAGQSDTSNYSKECSLFR